MAAAMATERSSTRRTLVVGGAIFLVLMLLGTAGIVITAARRAAGSGAAKAIHTTVATPATPFNVASAALDGQAAALLKDDEAGWLAAVDPGQPKLQSRYRTMFRSLRGLGVSQFAYRPYVRDSTDPSPATVALGVDVSYCFSMDTCPPMTGSEWDGAPRITQSLTLKLVGGHYVITEVDEAQKPNHLQPTPWENGELVFAHGKRVTVAAPHSEAAHLNQIVTIADRAALVNDRFAGFVGNPQKRYRIYLADAKTWHTWYGGETNNWVVGFTMPLNEAESDVVLQTSRLLADPDLLSTTIQHELGHVVTLGGVHNSNRTDDAKNLWLIEGIAEYIGWSPRPATASWRRQSVRAAMHGSHPATSIAAKPLANNAGAQAGDAFYGLGHFAADCMATKYGQHALFDFVKFTLREGYGYEQASQEAYGQPFNKVDKDCVRWIRSKA
jgi:hypothetical protein